MSNYTPEQNPQAEAARGATQPAPLLAAEPSQPPEMTINLVELMYYLLSKLYIILLGMVAGTLLMGYYAVSVNVPIYTATAKLYIVGQNENRLFSMADLQMGSALTNDYQEVFKAWEVHAMVNEQLGTNYAYSYLQSTLTVRNPEGTRVLYLQVRHTDPQMAADIANAYINAGKRFISSSMQSDEPSTFSLALVPTVASSISIRGYAMRGFLLGAVVSVGLLVLVFLLDSRPKSTEDILRYGGIPTLAVIPANLHLSGRGKNNRKVREKDR